LCVVSNQREADNGGCGREEHVGQIGFRELDTYGFGYHSEVNRSVLHIQREKRLVYPLRESLVDTNFLPPRQQPGWQGNNSTMVLPRLVTRIARRIFCTSSITVT